MEERVGPRLARLGSANPRGCTAGRSQILICSPMKLEPGPGALLEEWPGRTGPLSRIRLTGPKRTAALSA